ncbi:MAG: hypothetical protein IT332_15165 [Ardenticatenales bacterium]|nr:hypothetical protein [Ardenticatenales bacterium]
MIPNTSLPATALRAHIFEDRQVIATGIAALTMPQLRAIARGFGWPLAGLKRDDIVLQIERHYADRAGAAAAAAALSADEQALLSALAWLGIDTRSSLAAAFDRLQSVLPATARVKPPLHVGSRALDTAIERGLVLGDGTTSPPSLRVPWPLSVALPPPAWTPALKVPPSWRREPVGDGVADILAGTLALGRLGTVPTNKPFGDQPVDWHGHWPTLRGEAAAQTRGAPRSMRIPPAVSPLAVAARDAITRAVGDPDERRSAFIAAQLAGLGLIDVERKTGAAIDPDVLDRWLAVSPQERVLTTLVVWLQLRYPTWDEVSCLVRADTRLQHRRSADYWRNAMQEYHACCTNLRVDTLCGLHRLPRPRGRADEAWADGPALARLVTAAWPEVFLPSLEDDGWCMADSTGKPLDIKGDDGRRAAEALFAFLHRGPLRWLGLVETAVAPAGGAWAVRLSPLGLAIVTGDESALTAQPFVRWGSGSAASPSPDGATADEAIVDAATADAVTATVTVDVRWNADAAFQAVRPLGAYVGPAADAGAARASNAGAPPTAVVFRLGPDTLQSAFEKGAKPADVVRTLTAAGVPLPAPVATAIATWWAAWGTVNRYTGLALIEVADEATARLLRATTKLGEWVVCEAGPRTFVVAEASVDGLLDELRRAGHTPRVEVGAAE